MDIIASILAYLISLTGIVAAMAIAFVIYFAPPSLRPDASDTAAAQPRLVDMATPSEIKGIDKTDLGAESKAEKAQQAQPAVALDAQQKPPISRTELRRLAEKDRAKRLAERANTDFETRFLHFED
jgi:hypothetical protein